MKVYHYDNPDNETAYIVVTSEKRKRFVLISEDEIIEDDLEKWEATLDDPPEGITKIFSA